MNQTNRQFVQVPAFHLPSFNIPPQILAYYTVLVQRIREILQDDGTTIYGLALSPKLINILSVSSLAVQDVLPEHQWISISMDETSFYSLKTTTATLAHEISHFIGQESRDRKKRKSCILICAFQLLFGDILHRLYALVNQQYGRYSNQGVQLKCPTFEFKQLGEIAERLWQEAVRTCGSKYRKDQELFSRDLADTLKTIPSDIMYTPQLAESIFREICALMHEHPGKFEAMLSLLKKSFCHLNKSSGDNLLEGKHFQKIIEERLRALFCHAIADLNNDFSETDDLAESDVDICRLIGSLCYIFRETFADLQAILLLDMHWSDYCELMRRPPKSGQVGELIEDSPLRMLAVARALLESGRWGELEPCGQPFEIIRKFTSVRISKAITDLERQQLNPCILYYLVEYLLVCEEKIENHFTDSQSTDDKVKIIQGIYTSLSDKTALMELQKTLLLFIEAYREDLLKKEIPCSVAAV